MSTLPLGTLLQAQAAAGGEGQEEDSSSSEAPSDEDDAPEQDASDAEDADGPPLEFKLAADRKPVEKRSDRHA